MRSRPIIAIDGPAGAGKSTIARRLAETLGFVLVDTGAIYRTVALAAQRDGLSWLDETAIAHLARSLVEQRALRFDPPTSSGVRVWLRGDDVSAAIRTPEISKGASAVSAYPGVREALLQMQRDLGRAGGVVLEGRDIGTVVFPEAEVKFFLTARPEVRARRRHEELLAKGQPSSFEETLAEVRQRDARDTERPVSPLRQAADATLVDSSDIDIEEAVRQMAHHVKTRLASER